MSRSACKRLRAGPVDAAVRSSFTSLVVGSERLVQPVVNERMIRSVASSPARVATSTICPGRLHAGVGAATVEHDGLVRSVRPVARGALGVALARIAEPDRSRPGAGDGCGGLVSGHDTRTDFLRLRAIGSAFVLIFPWAAVQVIGRWCRFGQKLCRGPDRFHVVLHWRSATLPAHSSSSPDSFR